MKKFWLLIIAVGFLLINACENKDGDGTNMQYLETKCDNPWAAEPPGQEDYIVQITKALEDNGVKILSIYIDVYDENAGKNCITCNCPTGRYVVINVHPSDIDEAKALGFIII